MKKLVAVIIALVLLMGCACAESTPGLTKFTAKDMMGTEYTEAIFADYDLTMVNIWATWCGYCIEEMPAFVELKNSLPDNVNLITICDDGEYEAELALDILVKTGANYITLAANTDLYNQLLGSIRAFPTTVFVDSQGNIVGEMQVGVPSLNDPAGAYMQLINDRLALLGK